MIMVWPRSSGLGTQLIMEWPSSRTTRWGYTDPTDAAQEILHEAIDPIIDEMQRHLELGHGREALETCKGLVLGLYDARNKKNDGCLGLGARLLLADGRRGP